MSVNDVNEHTEIVVVAAMIICVPIEYDVGEDEQILDASQAGGVRLTHWLIEWMNEWMDEWMREWANTACGRDAGTIVFVLFFVCI